MREDTPSREQPPAGLCCAGPDVMTDVLFLASLTATAM